MACAPALPHKLQSSGDLHSSRGAPDLDVQGEYSEAHEEEGLTEPDFDISLRCTISMYVAAPVLTVSHSCTDLPCTTCPCRGIANESSAIVTGFRRLPFPNDQSHSNGLTAHQRLTAVHARSPAEIERPQVSPPAHHASGRPSARLRARLLARALGNWI